jgi:uncharacterized protein
MISSPVKRSIIIIAAILCLSSGMVAWGQSPLKKTDSLHSSILKEKRVLFIHTPAATMADQRYPVIFVLDGEVSFSPLVSALEQLKLLDKVIVVAIGNLWQRYRDYSPSHIASSLYVDNYNASITGGGDQFISFLEKELTPYIKAGYPVTNKRALIGHSMGGLIVMDILLKHTRLFDCYAAIDPSMWWDNEKLLKESGSLLKTGKFEHSFLFLAAANTTNKEMNLEQLRSDRSDKSVLIRPTLTLKDLVDTNRQKLKSDWKYYINENHLSVFSPALVDALKPLYDFIK